MVHVGAVACIVALVWALILVVGAVAARKVVGELAVGVAVLAAAAILRRLLLVLPPRLQLVLVPLRVCLLLRVGPQLLQHAC